VEYKPLFAGLINCWRKDRNDPDLPFYFVQLPNFRFVTKKGVENLYWSVIRQAQLEVYKEVPNTGMVVTIDAGDSTNIHPTDKEIIGNRLADWALANNYGKKELIVSGPVPKSLKRSGAQLVVKFDFAGKKLIGRNGKSLAGFTISDQSSPEVFVTADAFIKKDKVIISNPNIKKTAVVRYGWDDNPDASLFNEAGLPATPFVIKIDDKTKISM
jgi:sialate O-acetylesterase